MTLNELPSHIEIDIQGSLARFSNFEPMYLKYLKRFNTEPTYDELLNAVKAQDFKGIEVAAHTLKGIAGNLGLTALCTGFDKIVKAVRAGNNELALKLCSDIEPKVNLVRETLAKLD